MLEYSCELSVMLLRRCCEMQPTVRFRERREDVSSVTNDHARDHKKSIANRLREEADARVDGCSKEKVQAVTPKEELSLVLDRDKDRAVVNVGQEKALTPVR